MGWQPYLFLSRRAWRTGGIGTCSGSVSAMRALASVTLSSQTVGRAGNESSKPMTKRACHGLGRNFPGSGVSWSVK